MNAAKPASRHGYRSCNACRHFNGRASDIEAALPGLSSLSSAYAAVRANDGICAVHDRYVAGSSVCDAYEPDEAFWNSVLSNIELTVLTTASDSTS